MVVSASGLSERERLTGVRIQLLAHYPFFGNLAMHMELIEDNMFCPTTATDGDKFYFNSGFTGTLNGQELLAIMAHEVLHAAFAHPFRMSKAHDKFRYNIACDIIINDLIASNNIGTLPGDLATVDTVNWKIKPNQAIQNYSADMLYTMLGDDPKVSCAACAEQEKQKGSQKDQGDSSGGGSAGDQEGEDGENPGEGSGTSTSTHNHGTGKQKGSGTKACGGVIPKGKEASQADEWRARIESAAQAAKSKGKLPAGMEEYIDNLHSTKKSWLEVLLEWATPYPQDYGYTPPDRRFTSWGQEGGPLTDVFTAPVVMPGVIMEEKVSDIVFAVDTSGSMSTEELRDGISEAVEVAKISLKTWICYCDARVETFEEMPDDGIPPQPKGRGGTEFKPVFDKVEQMIKEGKMNEVKCLIYFTDGYGYYNFPKPDYPVLWVINNDQVTPEWGEVIRYP